MARAVRAWAARLKEHVVLDDGEVKRFVERVEDALDGRTIGLNDVATVGVEVNPVDAGVLRWVFDLYNTDGASMPGWLRARETKMVHSALQLGVREFQDGVVVWAGPTLRDARYVATLERVDAKKCQLKFYVLPKLNVVGWVLVNGLCEESWALTIFGLKNTDRLITTREDVYFQQVGCPVARFPRSAWPAVVEHLNRNAEAICDESGVDVHFRYQVENFICERAGFENVSDADLARCMARELRKRNGKQLFGVYEDVYGTVHGGGF